MEIEGMEGVDKALKIKCPPINQRHKFGADGRCIRCNLLRDDSDQDKARKRRHREAQAFVHKMNTASELNIRKPPVIPAGTKISEVAFGPGSLHYIPSQPLSGTAVKLERLSELFTAYADARSELMHFLNQHRLQQLDLTDPLEDPSREALDLLYKELGREIFWGRQNEGSENRQRCSSGMEQKGPPFIPSEFGDGMDGGSDPSPF